MFENMNPLDRPTAFIEIGLLLLISFILGYVCAKLFGKTTTPNTKIQTKEKVISKNEAIDLKDFTSDPTTIKAVLTRDRKGNAIAPISDNTDYLKRLTDEEE